MGTHPPRPPHSPRPPGGADAPDDGTHAGGHEPARGRVHLVGAGPGDPGLLTARALELIARADTILYDRLIGLAALDGARAEAELLFVGKQGGGASVPQERTQQLMIERALAGREVVRLKGGDPFVFGRGGEEALALRAAGIEFDVVPGVTAGVAASAYAGIPVTHRGLSTAVALITGHTQMGASEDPDRDESELDWAALARFPGTLVFYMGVRALERIATELIDAGRPASESAVVIERGTLPDQRTVTGTLATIAQAAAREQVKAPAITVVGAVGELADRLAWLPRGPLAGRTVAVTRARARASTPWRGTPHGGGHPEEDTLKGTPHGGGQAGKQASELARRLEALGASVVQAPSIRTLALPDAPAALDPTPYDLVCLTSPVGVEMLFERLEDGRHPRGDARSLAHARVAAIGPGTARALAERGIVADVVPERYVAESLVQALSSVPVGRALIARAKEARDVLPDALRERGAEVDVVALYETLAEPLSPQAREQAQGADYVTFTSSSTVRFFLQACGADAGDDGDGDGEGGPSASKGGLRRQRGGPLAKARVVSIGPVTSATLREHGIEPDVEAERHDIDGLVAALVTDAGRRNG